MKTTLILSSLAIVCGLTAIALGLTADVEPIPSPVSVRTTPYIPTPTPIPTPRLFDSSTPQTGIVNPSHFESLVICEATIRRWACDHNPHGAYSGR